MCVYLAPSRQNAWENINMLCHQQENRDQNTFWKHQFYVGVWTTYEMDILEDINYNAEFMLTSFGETCSNTQKNCIDRSRIKSDWYFAFPHLTCIRTCCIQKFWPSRSLFLSSMTIMTILISKKYHQPQLCCCFQGLMNSSKTELYLASPSNGHKFHMAQHLCLSKAVSGGKSNS